ncbi:MAG: SRPBCC family protein [Nocardioidaceae bacterium]|nr:SRPBCC family protein [Nocardioidaceae bacterium]
MARFEVSRETSLPAEVAWNRLTSWESHGRFIPLTTVTSSGEGAGATFCARTAVGPFGFDDIMEITAWEPPTDDSPGRCRIVKRGRVVGGWAELVVTPTAAGATVRWLEEASIRRTGRVLELPSRIVSRIIFTRLVDGLLDVSQASH